MSFVALCYVDLINSLPQFEIPPGSRLCLLACLYAPDTRERHVVDARKEMLACLTYRRCLLPVHPKTSTLALQAGVPASWKEAS